jgi:hypothetical protein
MTEDDLKQFLEDNKTEIQAEIKRRTIDKLLADHRWEITSKISAIVDEFVASEIVPMVKAHLTAQKGPIIEAAIKGAAGIGDMLAQSLVERATKKLAPNSYEARAVLKSLFE